MSQLNHIEGNSHSVVWLALFGIEFDHIGILLAFTAISNQPCNGIAHNRDSAIDR